MNALLISAGVLFLITAILNGFSFLTIFALITTIMFCGRKVGYYTTVEKVVPLEAFGMFFTSMLSLIFHKFVLWKFIVTLILRVAFVLLLWYDSTYFVYIKEEQRLNEEDRYS